MEKILCLITILLSHFGYAQVTIDSSFIKNIRDPLDVSYISLQINETQESILIHSIEFFPQRAEAIIEPHTKSCAQILKNEKFADLHYNFIKHSPVNDLYVIADEKYTMISDPLVTEYTENPKLVVEFGVNYKTGLVQSYVLFSDLESAIEFLTKVEGDIEAKKVKKSIDGFIKQLKK